MSEIDPITPASCEKITGTRVHHVEHLKKSRDPSFEHLRIYNRNSPIKKHIPNTLVRVLYGVRARTVTRYTKIIRDYLIQDEIIGFFLNIFLSYLFCSY